jgi:chemotaxis methyl-accepting protein methylase
VRTCLSRAGPTLTARASPRLLRDESFFAEVLAQFSITVTEMFRDPGFFRAFRENVVPFLKTYPYAKIWHAGCATGEEVYSTAIVLEEEGFYDRVTMFATDFNAQALGQAKEGIYPLERMRDYTASYQAAGGRRSFADYYRADSAAARLETSLKRNITFCQPQLVTDACSARCIASPAATCSSTSTRSCRPGAAPLLRQPGPRRHPGAGHQGELAFLLGRGQIHVLGREMENLPQEA